MAMLDTQWVKGFEEDKELKNTGTRNLLIADREMQGFSAKFRSEKSGTKMQGESDLH
jgi:hypothetical protein